ncbi:rab-GTPase-TBC domain-containing protein [Entophlyctis helioformis]|nr:rab-GTPase-TBC domain-containing protein [Entophlyctis helioformis]
MDRRTSQRIDTALAHGLAAGSHSSLGAPGRDSAAFQDTLIQDTPVRPGPPQIQTTPPSDDGRAPSLGSPTASSPDGPVFDKNRVIDEYGFYEGTSDASTPQTVTSSERKHIIERETEWLGMLEDWEWAKSKKKMRIKKLCREGIPDSVRANVWMMLAGVNKIREVGLYESLVRSTDAPSIFDIIERDINRCYPNHMMFAQKGGEGQHNLRKVLRAYALYNPELGYCQGMGMLVGLLLMRMSPEDAFWLLAATLKFYIPGYHSANLYELRVDATAFELAMQKHLKQLGRHMAKIEVSPLTYMTQWFLTLYTMALPWRTVLRVWDMFFCDGPKALFRVGLGIMATKKGYLLKHCPSASDAVPFLLQVPHEFVDPDALMAACLKIKIKREEVDKFRARAKRSHASLDENLNRLK